MKHILISLVALIAIQYAQAKTKAKPKPKTNCTIQGTVLSGNDKLIFMKNLSQDKYDTVEVNNSMFKYECFVAETTPFIISNEENKYQLFFAEPQSNIQLEYIQAESRLSKVTGSNAQLIFDKLMKQQAVLQKQASIVQQIHAKSLNQDSLNKVMVAINDTLRINYFNFLTEYGNTEVAAFVVNNSIVNSSTVTLLMADSMYRLLRDNGRASHFGVQTAKIIEKMNAVQVGSFAPDFTLPDATGLKNYTLSSYKGKYVLIDFWASWCGPCKQEIPHLKTAYEKFHAKGFEIISVSLDDKKEKWLDALTQFKMPWIQISDTKGFGSVVNSLYHIPSIPKTLLLDKEGKIIATDLRGTNLEDKLAEVL